MSNKTMTITDISKSSKQFKNTHTIQVGGFGKTKQPPEWFTKFANEVMSRFDKQEQFNQWVVKQFEKQDQFNQYVLDQFKKHGWVK